MQTALVNTEQDHKSAGTRMFKRADVMHVFYSAIDDYQNQIDDEGIKGNERFKAICRIQAVRALQNDFQRLRSFVEPKYALDNAIPNASEWRERIELALAFFDEEPSPTMAMQRLLVDLCMTIEQLRSELE